MERYTACGEDEDAVSMARTALHRLIRRCSAQPAEIGALHVGPSLLDRSKSIKTELMALVEAAGCSDAEGADGYGACAGEGSALLRCISWVQSDSWDGRWAVAVGSSNSIVSRAAPFWNAAATAVLVGRDALQIDEDHALAPHCTGHFFAN